MDEPMDVLRHEHQIILKVMAGMGALGLALAEGQDVNADRLRGIVRFLREFADRCHHAKEEGILFPALVEMGVGDAHGPIAALLNEHKQARELVSMLSDAIDSHFEARNAASAGAVATLLSRIENVCRGHIAKEDNVLFPMAERLLSEDERAILFDDFEAEEKRIGMDHEKLEAFADSFERRPKRQHHHRPHI